ncbi:MAG TPA: hypothetical protein VEY09_02775 [Pyrinomonadaceae bacterium]|nr:hypothetical protein [Pyrinomonadaceae bacterium]
MSRRRKVALALVALLVLSQAPFIYRRWQLSRLRENIRALEASRQPAPPEDPFDDHPGVFHVHSSLGGHSPGTLGEIVAAASANGLAFVVMTEHPAAGVNTAEATLSGTHEGVIFVGGSELVAAGGERLFVAPGFASPAPAADHTPVSDLIRRASAEGRLSAIGYPGQVRAWDFAGYDAVEVYNLFTNTKEISYPRLFFDGLWSYWGYPDLLFATFYRRPEAALRKWDELNAAGGSRLAALAGNDSHANVGFRLGGGAKPLLKFYLDPYERSFRVVRNRVLLPKGTPPTAGAVLEALRAGRSYVGFDIFGDAGGFRFTAALGSAIQGMGDEVRPTVGEAVRLSARSPVKARFVFFRDGRAFREVPETTTAEVMADERGAYRVEVYLDGLGPLLEGKPWIISNPIYVR